MAWREAGRAFRAGDRVWHRRLRLYGTVQRALGAGWWLVRRDGDGLLVAWAGLYLVPV